MTSFNTPPHRNMSPFGQHELLIRHTQELYLKHQCRSRGDNTIGSAAITVCELARNNEFSVTTDFHRRQPFIPTSDYTTLAQGELYGFPSFVTGTIKLLAICQPARIVYFNHVA